MTGKFFQSGWGKMIKWLGMVVAALLLLAILLFDVFKVGSVALPPVAEAARPPHPNFWVAPPFAIPTAAGLNRTNWDLHYDPPPAFSHSFEISANPGLTPASPEGALAPPGTYTIRLTVAAYT